MGKIHQYNWSQWSSYRTQSLIPSDKVQYPIKRLRALISGGDGPPNVTKTVEAVPIKEVLRETGVQEPQPYTQDTTVQWDCVAQCQSQNSLSLTVVAQDITPLSSIKVPDTGGLQTGQPSHQYGVQTSGETIQVQTNTTEKPQTYISVIQGSTEYPYALSFPLFFDFLDDMGASSEAEILATLKKKRYPRGQCLSYAWQAPQSISVTYGAWSDSLGIFLTLILGTSRWSYLQST